ncbi:MAG: YdcF family protein [Zoogloeaceae bacterium]|uniref:YdcF family protein n=1 Tax=Denitromonas sp. TaxID=2734609 RepID=UPI001D65B6F4|nr:YdcF family protein [Rhodocyclaceae bacterium]MCP5222670.1 YdcF family protein [Zoogloeaceae bacterium]HQU90454.1 YdcF family protein [Denitromonas sp.]
MEPALIAFWAKKIIAVLILPPAGPLLLIGLGLMVSRLRTLAWLGWLYALVVSMPITVNWLAAPLETAAPISEAALRQTQAIVILGAGTRTYAPEYGHATVSSLALERLRYGAKLARDSGRPLLVAGGAPEEHTPEAPMMRDVIENEYGIVVRWAESASLDTRDNANLTARMLRDEGVERIALVTHAAHMPRAKAAFEAAGLHVTPAPTAWLSNPDTEIEFGDFIPNARSAYAGWFATHEWVGGLAYRLTAPPPPARR